MLPASRAIFAFSAVLAALAYVFLPTLEAILDHGGGREGQKLAAEGGVWSGRGVKAAAEMTMIPSTPFLLFAPASYYKSLLVS